jgi:hypothetical protein
MTSVRIYIATTQGPAEVQRITREDRSVQSVVCLNGKAMALPVSPAYDAFVRRPTGVVEAAYGHPAYRMDVSAPIAGGMSWQLGALVAHGLLAAGRLAEKNEAATSVFWLTGEVDRDLCVEPVDHLSDKIRTSGRLLSELRAAGMAVTLCLPRQNLGELDPDSLEALGAGGVEVLAVDSVIEVFEAVGLDVPRRPAEPDGGNVREPARRRTGPWAYGLAGALAFVVGIAVVANWNRPHRAPPPAGVQAPVTAAVAAQLPAFALSAVAHYPPDGETCARVALGAAEAEVVETALVPGRTARTDGGEALCRLRYRVTNAGPKSELWIFGARAATGARQLNGKTLARARELPAGAALSLDIPLPSRFEGPLTHRLAVVALSADDAATRNRLTALAAHFEARLTRREWRRMIEDMDGAGLAVFEAAHELSP